MSTTDLDLVRQKLKQQQTKNAIRSSFWQPKSGENIIRIVPYKFNKEYPFIELKFHYQFNGKTLLSPSSFGRPDPILELADKLKSTGAKDDWKLGQELTPKQRNFAPIIVRGEEKDGVKFWGFGITVYTELMEYMVDPDYGDIADIMTGRDITVTYKTKEQTNTNYPSTSIRIKPNQSPVADDATLLEKILNEQIEITEIYKEPSYEDLEKELERFLNPESQDVEVTTTPTELKKETESSSSIEDVMKKFKKAVKD